MNYSILKGENYSPLRLLLPLPDNNQEASRYRLMNWQPVLFLIILLLLWFCLSAWLQYHDPAGAVMSQSIWLLIILSVITFLLILALCYWLLSLFWIRAQLPPLFTMVSQFKTLAIWQQLSFYLALYALLLLAACLCLTAIC